MDVERTMQFLLGMQAAHDERLARLETSVTTVTDLIGRLAQAEIRLVERLDTLAASQTSLTASQAALAESQTATDERLNALIAIVDKLIRRNGGSR